MPVKLAASLVTALGLPVGRYALDEGRLEALVDEGRARAKGAITRVGARRLADWAYATGDLLGQVWARLGDVVNAGDATMSYFAQEERAILRSDVASVLFRAAIALRYGGEAYADDTSLVLSLAKRDGGSLAFRLRAMLHARAYRSLPHPPEVAVVSYVPEDVGGVRVSVGRVPGEYLGTSIFQEGFARYRRGAARYAPWLLSHGCQFKLAPYRSFTAGAYAHYDATATLHVPRITTPSEAAHIAAHEQGHHLWHTFLTESGRQAWSDTVRDVNVPLDTDRLLSAWAADPLSPLRVFGPKLAKTIGRGVFGLQVAIAAKSPSLSGLDRSRFLALLARGETPQVPVKPVSVYGHASAQEAFCEALAQLVAYGPGTVDPQHLDLLARIAPRVRIANPAPTRSSSRTRSWH